MTNPSYKSHPSADFLKKVYSEIYSSYERMNRILTLGLDRLWRRQAVKIAASSADGGRWLDMCTGTGETAVSLSRIAPEGTRIFAADFSPSMIAQARKKPDAACIMFVNADIHELPFPDESFSLITMSFAARNVNADRDSLIHGFSELRRILKPGGVFVNLETSQPRSPIISKCFHLFVRLVVIKAGKYFSGDNSGYAYLSGSIIKFYSAEELAEILKKAGFGEVSFKRMMMGAVAVHKAGKG